VGLLEIWPGLYIVSALPFLYYKKRKLLIFADTHLGFEEDMASKGVYLPKVQLKNVLEMLDDALSSLSVERVVIVGDVKHNFSKLTYQEGKELRELFGYLKSRGIGEIHLVRGNHDNYVGIVASKMDVLMHDEAYVVDDIVFIHGHKSLPDNMEAKLIIMGHEHPSIGLRDEIGFIAKFSCFLKTPLVDGLTAIVLPASGIYQTGTRVSLARTEYLSPIMREKAVLEKAKPYIIDKEIGVMEFPELKLLLDVLS